MTRACRNAKVPHHHPHDFAPADHVSASLGVAAPELAERAGHSKPSMSLDVYSHVMPAERDRVRAVPVPAHGRGEVNAMTPEPEPLKMWMREPSHEWGVRPA